MAAPSSGPSKQKKIVGKAPFKAPQNLPRSRVPLPPGEDEDADPRAEPISVRPGPVPEKLRQAAHAAGLTFKPELPNAFAHAAGRQGRPLADRMLRSAVGDMAKKGVRFGSGGFDHDDEEQQDEQEEKPLVVRLHTERQLREAFNIFDLDGNEFIDAAELKHIFAQIGEMPSDNEISAMILLCDPRGDGTVNFDDFLNVFSNPAESLRNANIKGLKHLLPRKSLDFDVRDPLGIVLEEKVRLKDVSLVIVEVKKGSQAQEAGVKTGWKIQSLDAEPVSSEKEFNAKIKQRERAAEPDDEADYDLLRGGKKGKGRQKGKDTKKKVIKYDYNIVFEVLAGIDDPSSSEESEEEEEGEALEDQDDDEDEEA